GTPTRLAPLRAEIKNRAFYWPPTDRVAFRFATQANLDEPQVYDDDEDELRSRKSKQAGFSSGERQLRSLEEIVQHTDAAIYLLDEWDGNLTRPIGRRPARWWNSSPTAPALSRFPTGIGVTPPYRSRVASIRASGAPRRDDLQQLQRLGKTARAPELRSPFPARWVKCISVH